MAYFCEKTGARLIAPGVAGEVMEHDGSPAADAAEHAARAHIRAFFESNSIGTPADKPAPEAGLAAAAAKVGAEVYQAARRAEEEAKRAAAAKSGKGGAKPDKAPEGEADKPADK